MSLCEARVGSVYVAIAKSQNKMYIFFVLAQIYSGFQIDELHHHNQNLVGRLHATSLLWSNNMKTAVTQLESYFIMSG